MKLLLVEGASLVYLGILYLVMTLAATELLRPVVRWLYPSFVNDRIEDPGTTRPPLTVAQKLTLALSLTTIAALIQVLVGLVRRAVRLVPFPMDGWYKYSHKDNEDINGGVLMS